MKLSINLLQETQKISSRIRRIGLVLQTVSIAVLVGFSVLVFMIFSYSLIVTNQNRQIGKRIDEKKSEIENLKPVEIRHMLVKQKLNQIDEILLHHGIDYEVIVEMFNFLSDKILVGKIAYSETTGQLLFGGQADNVITFTEFMEQLVGYAETRGFAKVVISEFSRSSEGRYIFEISVFVFEG